MSSTGDQKKLLRELERQGGKVKSVKKGYIVYPPDPEAAGITIHNTPSDSRAWKNMIAELRRAGFNL